MFKKKDIILIDICIYFFLILVDTIRTLQQTTPNFKYNLPLSRYWSGLTASVVLTVPAFTTYMVAYRQTKRELSPILGPDALSNYIISGAVAELASSFIWTPMEVVKGRVQLANGNIKTPTTTPPLNIATSVASAATGNIQPNKHVNASTLKIIKEIYKTDGGIKGFFRGYWMGIIVFVPHSIFWWTTYEKSKTFLVNHFLPEGATNQDLTTTHIAIASVIGTTAATSAANFLDVVKTRQQLAVSDELKRLRPDDSKSVWIVARNLIRENGIFRALVKGLHIRLLHALPSGVLSMVIVETLNPDVSEKEIIRQSFEEEGDLL